MENTWDHLSWDTKFRKASKKRKGFRELRTAVFKSTTAIVEEGFYFVDGQKIELGKCEPQETEFYKEEQNIELPKSTSGETSISTINADCIEIAQLLAQLGHRPAILNMASQYNPGGGVSGGAGAQEENIFRRSNFYTSLFQFVDYGHEYNVPRDEKYSYPLDENNGAVYTPDVTVFRGSEFVGYCLLKKTYKFAFITVPAISRPPLVKDGDNFKISREFVGLTKNKIRLILRIAIAKKHDSLILSAFGCGAYKNPPKHMAELFNQVFEELEFKNKIKAIVFSIIDDHNAKKEHNPEGNILPFLKTFE